MKRTGKKAFTLAGAAAVLAATALSLISCGSTTYDSEIPDGWEVVRTEGNVEYLSLTDEGMKHQLRKASLNANDFSGYLNLYEPLENDPYLFYADGNDIKLIYYYGGKEGKVKRESYTLRISTTDWKSVDESYFWELSVDLQSSDLYDIREDADNNAYATHAVRVTVPASAFDIPDGGLFEVQLLYYRDPQPYYQVSEVVVNYNRLNFRREDDGILLGHREEDLDLRFRRSFPNVLAEVWYLVVPALLLLEIALFVLSIVRERYVRSQLAVCLVGAVYSAVAMNYFDSLPGYGMFPGLDHFGETILLFFSVGVFVALTVVFAIIFAIVQNVRKNRKWKKSVAQSCIPDGKGNDE